MQPASEFDFSPFMPKQKLEQLLEQLQNLQVVAVQLM
ncbi:MAG: hypothetical protein CM15mV51_0780 [uncultured marine virus]|nr:MAG: hypothetical protein CM15mV51_0780 [uncultured marine virus]